MHFYNINLTQITLNRAAGGHIATSSDLRAARAAENPSGRFGTPDEFGAACAYLCSSHAGYITGQNLLIDGGGYPGTY